MKYSDQRNHKRFVTKGGIGLTSDGVCQVINLSTCGVSLKCFLELVFPPEWTMDIYDEADLNLQELKIKKSGRKYQASQVVHYILKWRLEGNFKTYLLLKSFISIPIY